MSLSDTNAGEGHSISSAKLTMRYLVRALIKYNASDLHIRVRRPPLFRINGKLVPAKMAELTSGEVEEIISPHLSEKQKHQLEEQRFVDFSFGLADLGRFRCNIFYQRGSLAASIRAIPFILPNFDDLHLPPVLKDLVQRPQGLVLVTGATGSGKSTTLASLINLLNETKHLHVLVVEDPIEFMYRDQKATISQREVGTDVLSFSDALYAGLRQDPDVIVIGEMRDRETIQAALTAAETGHLVLSTLHTNSAKSTIDRILDVFPAEAKNQVRIQLASSLIGIVSQKLLLRSDQSGRIPACEVLVNSPTIEQLILNDEREKIPDIMATSNAYYRMQTLNMALEKLVKSGWVKQADAIKFSDHPEDLEMKLAGIARESGYETNNWGAANVFTPQDKRKTG